MGRIAELGYVTIEVEDLDAAIDFYARVARLEVTEQRPDSAFLGYGSDTHWVRLERGSTSRVLRIAYRLTGPDALEEIRAELDRRGTPFTEGGDFATDRVDRWIRFVDPAGIEWELYIQRAELAVPIEPNGVGLKRMLHTLWDVPNFDAEDEFCQRVLGFKASDYVENSVVFLRADNGYHHSFGLARNESLTAPRFSHFCILVDSLDDVMRLRNNALSLGLELEEDLLRHPTSGSTGVYITEPWQGWSIEFTIDHAKIEDENHIPRRLTAAPGAMNIWQQPLPEPRVNSKEPFTVALAAKNG